MRVVVSSPAAKPASSDTSDVIGVEEHLQVISAWIEPLKTLIKILVLLLVNQLQRNSENAVPKYE